MWTRLDVTDRASLERAFELRFIKANGASFQDLFTDVMARAYPGDFQRVRAHGSLGDWKCDGYLRSRRAVFQVYAPHRVSVRRALVKIREDFAGAADHWTGRMDAWVFVHNSQTGLPPPVVQFLDDLATKPGSPVVEVWGFEEMRLVLQRILPEDASALFPGVAVDPASSVRRRLPDATQTERYWSWLAGGLPESSMAPESVGLVRIDLPLSLEKVDPGDQPMIDGDLPGQSAIQTPSSTATASHSVVGSGTHKRQRISLAHALRRNRRLLIVGPAASGKSTLLRRFVVGEGTRLRDRGFARANGQTPLLVDLWRFSATRTIDQLVLNSVTRSGAGVTEDNLIAALERGYVVLLLDGLDEVPRDERRQCLAQVADLVDRYPRSRFVVSSRPFPEPPRGFQQLNVAPLQDSDIAAALKARFGSGRTFRDRFDHHDPASYIAHGMRPEVRQLCRRPLTLGLVLTLLANDVESPTTLFDVYDRFLSMLLSWERRTGRLNSETVASALLEHAAYEMLREGRRRVLVSDWVRTASAAAGPYTPQPLTTESAERVLEFILSAGLARETDGDIEFIHMTIVEFLAARRIARSSSPHTDPIAMNPGVARFLCSKLTDVTSLLECHLERCHQVQELVPLLAEASLAQATGGRFQELFGAIRFSQEIAIDLTYSREPDLDDFGDRLSALVNICLDFAPKALSLLKDAAVGVVTAVPWPESRHWFEIVLTGLGACGWEGAPLHRRLAASGFFERDGELADGSDAVEEDRSEMLFAYLAATDKDDFSEAIRQLALLEQSLGTGAAYRIPEGQMTLDEERPKDPSG